MEGITHVLLDIEPLLTAVLLEGTICPISFVKETLFPYALNALPTVLASRWDDAAFLPYRQAFPVEARASPQVLQAHVEDLTRRDVKVAHLKNLQGYLWEAGYRSGAYSTPLFADVAPQLKRWQRAGLDLAIYSSGSVFAQKLLFAHVNVSDSTAEQASGQHEDMTAIISGWFDTTNAGLKSESASYDKILAAMKWASNSTLFLSDNVKEIDAASAAGIRAVLVDRPGNAPVPDSDRERLEAISSLDNLTLPDT